MVKTIEEIRWMLNEIEGSGITLDDHMHGYIAALKWVLSEKSLAVEIHDAIVKGNLE